MIHQITLVSDSHYLESMLYVENVHLVFLL